MRSFVASHHLPLYVPYRVNTSSDQLGWRGFRAEVVRGHAPGELSLPPLDHHLLNFIVSARTEHEHRWAGRSQTSTTEAGSAALVPAGNASYWRWKYLSGEQPCDFHLHLHPAFVRRIACDSRRNLSAAGDEFQPELSFDQPELRPLVEALQREVESGGRFGPLYAESMAAAVVLILLTRQQPANARPHSGARVATRRIRMVCDYIEAHLGDELHLETLCGLAQMGPERLRLGFRHVTGDTPPRYVLRRRLERARHLLQHTQTPITQVALQLGFADHSHFTSVFRNALGVTPSRFRAATQL